MPSSPAIGHTRIPRAARHLRWAVFAGMMLIIALYAAARFNLRLGGIHIAYRAHTGGLDWGPLIGDGALVLLLVALFRLTQMLGRLAAGETFSAGVIRSFRGFAFWLLLMALFGMLAPIAAAFVLATPGAHQLQVAIDFREVLTVGITLLLFLIAQLLERARSLDEEVREFV